MILEVRALASRKLKTGFLSSSIIPMEDVARAFLETAKGTPLEIYATAKPTKFGERDGFDLRLHPRATPIGLVAEQHTVLFGTVTSSIGPGYHAFLVAALDAVQAKLGLKWESRGRMDDNTGYIRDRDFPRLQHTMAQSFKAACQEAIDPRGSHGRARYTENHGIFEGLNVEVDVGEVLTPFGPRPREVIEQWSTLEGSELERVAAGSYPWWAQGFDGFFYSGLALSLMWRRLRWAKTFDQGEGELLTNVLSWLNEAMQLGAPPPVPIEVIGEFMELVGPNAPDFPRPNGIGYRRRKHLVALDGWEVRLPFSLTKESAQAGPIVFRNHAFRVQISTGILQGSDPGGKPLAPGEVQRGGGFFPTDDGNGFQLEAVARTPSPGGPDRLCLLKIWMADENLRGMAEAIAESVSLVKTERD